MSEERKFFRFSETSKQSKSKFLRIQLQPLKYVRENRLVFHLCSIQLLSSGLICFLANCQIFGN